MPGLFGADATTIATGAGAWLGGAPDESSQVTAASRSKPRSPMVGWCRKVAATLKRERQQISEEMRRNTNLANGGTPWWRKREEWKISTRMNFCATIPLTWTAILCDAKPSVSYSALDRTKQRRADIATAAWNQAYDNGNWEKRIHDAILISRVQKKAYLRLTFDSLAHGGKGTAKLTVLRGDQVYMDRNATCVEDAEITMVEYRESYGSLCARFEGLRHKLQRKYDQNRDDQNANQQDVLAPPASYSFADVETGGGTVTTPAYAAYSNPPDSAAGTSGLLVREFWTRPHKTVKVKQVKFLMSGEPACKPKMFPTIDPKDSEPLRRVITEGGVIYELPQSLVYAFQDANERGIGIKILEDRPAMEAMLEDAKYPMYPDGRLVVIVDEDIEADDRMNPLGYTPLAEIQSNSDLAGGQYGPSDVDLIADVYEQLVRMVSLVHDTAVYMGNPIERYPISSEISNDDITNAPGAIRREDFNALKYARREPGVDLPSYILPYIKWLVDQIKDLSGLSDMATGKMPPKAQVSTETMTMGQEASGVRFRDSLNSISQCMQTLGTQFLKLMTRHYTSPVMVQIKNDAGQTEQMPMLGIMLTDPFIVEAKAGTRQPAGPTQRLTTILNLKNAGIPFDIETVYQLLEELGSITSASSTLRRVETLKNDPKQLWKVIGLPPPAGAGKPNQSKKPGSKRSKKSGAAG